MYRIYSKNHKTYLMLNYHQAPKTICILFLFFSFFGSAQIIKPRYSIEKIPSYETKKREVPVKILFSDDSGYYVLFGKGKHGRGTKSIRKFDTKLQPTKYRIDLSVKKISNIEETVDVVLHNKIMYHIWWSNIKGAKDFYVQKVDYENARVDEGKKIASIAKEEAYSDFFTTKIFTDSKSDLIHLTYNLPIEREDSEKLAIHSFDTDFNSVQSNIYHLPLKGFINVNNLFLEAIDTTKYVLLTKSYLSANYLRSEQKKEYEYPIFLLEDGKMKLLKRILPEGSFITSISAHITESGHLLASGVSSSVTISKPDGVYFLNYDLNTMRVAVEKRTSLPDDFYERPDKRNKKVRTLGLGLGFNKRNADNFYYGNGLLVADADNIFLMAEQRYSVVSDYGRITHYNKNIAVFKLDERGNLLYTTKIGKNQARANTEIYSSFHPVFHQEQLYLFYNGNVKNLHHLYGGKFENAFSEQKDRALICAIINPNGEFDKNVATYYSDLEAIIMRPALSNINDSGELVIFGQYPGNVKKQGFTKINFK